MFCGFGVHIYILAVSNLPVAAISCEHPATSDLALRHDLSARRRVTIQSLQDYSDGVIRAKRANSDRIHLHLDAMEHELIEYNMGRVNLGSSAPMHTHHIHELGVFAEQFVHRFHVTGVPRRHKAVDGLPDSLLVFLGERAFEAVRLLSSEQPQEVQELKLRRTQAEGQR